MIVTIIGLFTSIQAQEVDQLITPSPEREETIVQEVVTGDITATPNATILYGANRGGDSTTIIKFDLNIPTDAIISDATLTMYLEQPTTFGILNIKDTATNNDIDNLAVVNQGQIYTKAVKSTVQQWVSNPGFNQGFTFAANSIPLDQIIKLDGIRLVYSYTILDKTPPQFLSLDNTETSPYSMRIAWVADEEVIARIEYGKTSQYTSDFTPADQEYTKNSEIFLDTLNPGSTYHYRLVLIDKAGNRTVSKEQIVNTPLDSGDVLGDNNIADVSELAPPSNLAVERETALQTSKVILAWDASSTPNIDGYAIYRKSDIADSDYELLKQVSSSTLTFTDESISGGVTYTYFLRSIMGDYISDRSETVRVFVPIKEVLGISSQESNSGIFLINIAIAGIAIIVIYVMYKVFNKLITNEYKPALRNRSVYNPLKDPESYFNVSEVSEDKERSL